jgi:hypothetical protein
MLPSPPPTPCKRCATPPRDNTIHNYGNTNMHTHGLHAELGEGALGAPVGGVRAGAGLRVCHTQLPAPKPGAPHGTAGRHRKFKLHRHSPVAT